jgi:hypothetical protein
MEHTVVVTKPNYALLQARESCCTQCGEKLTTHLALPAARTELKLCSDCSLIDLPHTD